MAGGEGVAFGGESQALGFQLLDALAFFVEFGGFRNEKARAGLQLFIRRVQLATGRFKLVGERFALCNE